ncbi:hypothetical protein [Streptomyces sp. 184]|uniref:hypothetical protein n=1 Tax=Streptomyces sp. 184 TaxID=1827526 RepID=UPI003892BDC3
MPTLAQLVPLLLALAALLLIGGAALVAHFRPSALAPLQAAYEAAALVVAMAAVIYSR